MIIGENARSVDLDVNAIKEKKLSNMRTTSADEAMRLAEFVRRTPAVSESESTTQSF